VTAETYHHLERPLRWDLCVMGYRNDVESVVVCMHDGDDVRAASELDDAELASFDLFTLPFADDPYGTYTQLRSRCPVLQSDQVGWVLSRYADVSKATQDYEAFRSDWGAKGMAPALLPRTREHDGGDFHTYSPFPLLPIEVDPPDHRGYRRVLQAKFSAPAVQRVWDEPISRIISDVLEGLRHLPDWDGVDRVSFPVSGLVLAEIAGVPAAARDRFQYLVGRIGTMAAELIDFVREHLQTAGSGIFAELREARLGERPLTEAEQLGYAFTLIAAGWETTASAISNLLNRLATQPLIRERLIADPALIPVAIEEMLRIDPPVHGLWRTVAGDCEFEGVQMCKGDKAVMLWGAANHDPDEFDEPEQFRIDRHPNRHLTFGIGVHNCLGSHVARRELTVLLSTLISDFPPLRPASGGEPSHCVGSGYIYQFDRLPLTFEGP
jgi:cytochrome P450